MQDNVKLAVLVGLIILVIVAIVFQPLAIIWAINTIAPTMSIPYSFWTWLAVVVLNISTFGGLHSAIRSIKH